MEEETIVYVVMLMVGTADIKIEVPIDSIKGYQCCYTLPILKEKYKNYNGHIIIRYGVYKVYDSEED